MLPEPENAMNIPLNLVGENTLREIPSLTAKQIIKTLDIACLKPEATTRDITEAASEVEEIGAATVCVASGNVALARLVTQRVTAVIGFPHGNIAPDIKVYEARQAIEEGAAELDVVINYGRLLEGREATVRQELHSIVFLARKEKVAVKAILEISYYQPNQVLDACGICVDCGVDWVKTSTGFGPGGATPGVVELMVKAVEGYAQVKASGGIHTHADACMYLGMGCTRLGVGFTHYR